MVNLPFSSCFPVIFYWAWKCIYAVDDFIYVATMHCLIYKVHLDKQFKFMIFLLQLNLADNSLLKYCPFTFLS